MAVEDLKDVRPPVDLPPNYSWLFALFGLLIIAGIYFLSRWLLAKLKARMQAPLVVKTPWEIAAEELAALKKENLPSRGEVKEYFIRLSGIVRHYLENRFSVSAPEMTTDEFLAHIRASLVLNDQQKNSLKEFLTASDMVKFARYGSSATEMANALAVAERLIEETTPKNNIPV